MRLSCYRLAGRVPVPGTHRRCRSDLPGLGRGRGSRVRRPAGACHPSTRKGKATAALLLVAAGDHPERLRSESSWAHLCGVAPIPASSGKVAGRYRLNRGGNREANQALWRIVITRMRSHPATRAYVERRTKEGLSKREIIRCLKRYVASEVYRHLRDGA